MTYFELFVKGVAVAAALVSAVFLAGGLYGWWRFNLSKDAERLQSKLRMAGRSISFTIKAPLAILLLSVGVILW